jgi:hypothetical protein
LSFGAWQVLPPERVGLTGAGVDVAVDAVALIPGAMAESVHDGIPLCPH